MSWIVFGYFISLPISFLGLLIVPNYLTGMGMWSLGVVAYFLTIGVLMGYVILQILWAEEYLTKKDVINSFVNYVIIISFVHIINVILRFSTLAVHANYGGTIGEEYDALNKWLYSMINIPLLHQLPMWIVILVVEFLLLIPFGVFSVRKNNRSEMEEIVALGNLKAQQNHGSFGRSGGSQVLVNSSEKARPSTPKNVTNRSSSGFVSVTKEVKVNKDNKK